MQYLVPVYIPFPATIQEKQGIFTEIERMGISLIELKYLENLIIDFNTQIGINQEIIQRSIYGANYIISIDDDIYFDYAQKTLNNNIDLDSESIDFRKRGFNLKVFSTVKMIILAQAIFDQTEIRCLGTLMTSDGGRLVGNYQCSSNPVGSRFSGMLLAKRKQATNPISSDRIITSIEKYFHPIIWHVDKLAIGLRFLGNALFSEEPDIILIVLCCALESIVGANSGQSSPTIAERVAILMPSGDASIWKKRVEDMFDERQKLVHGISAQILTAGIKNWNNLWLTADQAIVPIEILADALSVVIHSYQNILSNSELLSIYQGENSNPDKEIKEYFKQKIRCSKENKEINDC